MISASYILFARKEDWLRSIPMSAVVPASNGVWIPVDIVFRQFNFLPDSFTGKL